ncbi:hypothetical protein SLA2020_197120 [Shorea laevis]
MEQRTKQLGNCENPAKSGEEIWSKSSWRKKLKKKYEGKPNSVGVSPSIVESSNMGPGLNKEKISPIVDHEMEKSRSREADKGHGEEESADLIPEME